MLCTMANAHIQTQYYISPMPAISVTHLKGFNAEGINDQGGLVPPHSTRSVLLRFIHLSPQQAHGSCVAELSPQLCVSCALLHVQSLSALPATQAGIR